MISSVHKKGFTLTKAMRAEGFTLTKAKRTESGFTLTKATRTESGFTLIELLVVISIIGILATLVTANLNATRSRGRDTVRKADLKTVQTALRVYYNDVGSYPTAFTFAGEFSSGGTIYMNSVPNDPLYDASDPSSPSYAYTPDPANDAFTLSACLENESDAKCVVDAGCPSGCGYEVKP